MTTNRIVRDEPLKGETAYVYGFKRRAHLHHCLGYGTFNIDLERLTALRKVYSRTVGPITFRPLYIKALAVAMKRSPEANAILFKRWFGLFGQRRIVQYDTVDVNLPVTRDVDGKTVTFIATVRDAASKTLVQIQEELSNLQRCPPAESSYIRRIQKFSRMPLWLAQLVHWLMTVSPTFYVNQVGTCGVTFIEGDWYDMFLPIGPTSIVMGMGAAHQGITVVDNQPTVRRQLKVGAMGDNYVVSGLTGAKLAKDFKDLLETGSVIQDELDRRA